MENSEKTTFTIKCLNPQCIGSRIQTSMTQDGGYSNWTVMSDGAVEFKCHGCGKFATTESYVTPNEPDNFQVTCDSCGSNKWSPNIQDVDENQEEPTNMECDQCHKKQFES